MIPERPHTTLGRLTLADLSAHPAWEGTRRYEATDEVLEALTLSIDGAVPREVGEVWCLSQCTLANGAVFPACALYRGDKSDGPDLWSIWFGGRWHSFNVPPAPDAVLQRRGPPHFASELGLPLEQVFPLTICAAVQFETAPSEREARVLLAGRA